jgi:ribosomal-protein-alanine N-acetyltransferase
MLEMPVLETTRLLIRPFVMDDLIDAHNLFDIELREVEMGSEKMNSLEERAHWLEWTVLNYEQLAMLNQPPYGDRAIVLKATGKLIGSCGYVPCLSAFEQIAGLAEAQCVDRPGRYTTEFGLFYAVSPIHQRQGFATEAAQALVDYAFQRLHLKRVIAKTTYDNNASIGVMKKLGMRIEKNPQASPPWLQIVGVLDFTPSDPGAAQPIPIEHFIS